MIDMKDFVSVVVFIVFLVIVFRKRISPLLKVFRKPKKEETAVSKASDSPELQFVDNDCVFYDALAFDLSTYGNNLTGLCEDISLHLQKKMDFVRHKGKVVGIDCVPVSRTLVFLIRWRI